MTKHKFSFIYFIMIMSFLFPIKPTIAASNDIPNNLSTESVVLLDAKSGQVLYEKNGNKSMYPASLTKIATAIYALEKGNLDDIVTVSENARQVEGTRVYLEQGEQVSLLKLIKGLLINSGNDAAIAIAEHIDGNLENFQTNINEYLKTSVGLTNTNFTNPHGLFDPQHYTTAYDLAKLTQYAMKNELFRQIIGTKEMKWIGKSWSTTLYTHHKMMREIPYDGVTGGKTGYVDQSGQTLMTTAERDNLSLIVISLKGSLPMDTYNDTKKLLDYGFATFDTKLMAAGSEYKDDQGVTYTLPEDQYVTTYKDQDVQAKLSEDGMLLVNEEDEQFALAFPLQKEIVKSTVANAPDDDEKDTKSNNQEENTIWGTMLFGLFFILFGLLGWSLLRKWMRREQY